MSAETVVFKHRIPYTLDDNRPVGGLEDTVGPSIKRAHAIAELLEIASEVGDASCLHGELLRRVGQTICLELEDATALLNCYLKREYQERRSKQP
ncbi:hypothetical protein HC024_21925 [Methylococcaceae bacterium WWC4]|nr:hypothetical protein [Methylococcaceae bacterium WWC4]